MADDSTPEGSETEPAAAPEAPEPKQTPDLPKEVQAALRKANKEAETLRLKLKEIEDRDKTEAQKLMERLTTAEQERDALRLETVRVRVAHSKGLPPELADRLRGSSEEELLADADALLALVPAKSDGRPRGDVDQGVRSQQQLPVSDEMEQKLRALLGG